MISLAAKMPKLRLLMNSGRTISLVARFLWPKCPGNQVRWSIRCGQRVHEASISRLKSGNHEHASTVDRRSNILCLQRCPNFLLHGFFDHNNSDTWFVDQWRTRDQRNGAVKEKGADQILLIAYHERQSRCRGGMFVQVSSSLNSSFVYDLKTDTIFFSANWRRSWHLTVCRFSVS